jgi:hypothetical protein
MKVALDSATPPSVAQVQAAKAAGIAVWSGYLATRSGVRLFRPWTQAEFAVVKALPGIPIAYASGWDDPALCKAVAARWGVRLCLDVEGGIRGDGPWVQGWLDASGAGLYGTSGVHPGRRAAFHIAAWYLTQDPRASWPASWPRPASPCGWQWQNTHTEFGVGVDRCWFDDWFGGEEVVDQATFNQLVAGNPYLQDIAFRLDMLLNNRDIQAGGPSKGQPNALKVELDALKAELDALKNAAGTTTKPSAAFDATITPKP